MAAPTTQVLVIFKSVFDTTSYNTYKIRAQVYADDGTSSTTTLQVATMLYDGSFPTETIFNTTSAVHGVWIPIDIDYTTNPISKSTHKSLRILFGRTTSAFGYTMYIRNLRVEKIIKAEVQDSDIVGRRFYDGTKMSSTDINVDSPDTIDGGPVITINTVASTTPTYNPIGVSGPVATMTQQQQTGEA